MAEVKVNRPDFKVFFRRLIVPGELTRDLSLIHSLTPSQFLGLESQEKEAESRRAQSVIDAASKQKDDVVFQAVAGRLFDNYEPSGHFRSLVVKKATEISRESRAEASRREVQIRALDEQIKRLREQAQARASTRGLKQDTFMRLSRDVVFYRQSADETRTFDANPGAAGSIAPLERDRRNGTFTRTRQALGETKAVTDLGARERSFLAQVEDSLNTLIEGSPTPTAESSARLRIADALSQFLRLVSPVDESGQVSLKNLNDEAARLEQQRARLASEVDALSANPIRPFYEPILLDALIGPYQTQTFISREGQPGRASVSFALPLDSFGAVPDLFMGLEVSDIFSLNLLESQVIGRTAGPRDRSISSQTLGILKPNLRETTLLPFDMIQVWGRRRFSAGNTFPGDYYPMFTGFLTKIGVDYSGSSINVKFEAEDFGKIIRLARVNIDPNLDPRFRAKEIKITPFASILNSPSFKTGADLIRGLLVGSEGAFLGMSRVEVIDGVVERDAGGQTIQEFRNFRARTVSLAADFEKIRVNLFADLLNLWKPYPIQFKNAFRLVETDAKHKWDICKEVADITEFEFYVDQTGVVNYHPPLYFLNPFAPQYFIENTDIINESHVVDESAVKTIMEVNSQPGFNLDPAQFGALRRLSSIVAAPDPIIQRFGVRWEKKDVPIFSGTEEFRSRNVTPVETDKGRDGYARALLNRRNANFRSATVTITGTPEVRLCNTVAFVGDLKEVLRVVSTNQLAAIASGRFLGASTALASMRSLPPGVVAALRNVLVYYISGITHTYNQGGSFTTSLVLTHGRPWTEPLPQSSVGFSFDRDDMDDIVQSIRRYFGQDGIDPDAFIQAASNRVQFIATGNPEFLGKVDDDVFGFSARRVSRDKEAKRRARLAREIRGKVEAPRSRFCKRLLRENDPRNALKAMEGEERSISQFLRGRFNALKEGAQRVFKQIRDEFRDMGKLLAKGADKLVALARKGIDEQTKRLTQFINEIEERFFESLLRGRDFRILTKTVVSSGSAVPSTVTDPLRQLGVDLGKLTGFRSGIAIYTFVIRGVDSTERSNMNKALNELRLDAKKSLGADNDNQLRILVSQTIQSAVVVKPGKVMAASIVTDDGETVVPEKRAPSQRIIFTQGVAAFGIHPACK